MSTKRKPENRLRTALMVLGFCLLIAVPGILYFGAADFLLTRDGGSAWQAMVATAVVGGVALLWQYWRYSRQEREKQRPREERRRATTAARH
ncbi:MAG: hypothetical protein Q4G34_05990 [Micrococcus sp.]|nr:hypothetical protein [Micrococcus sp.]